MKKLLLLATGAMMALSASAQWAVVGNYCDWSFQKAVTFTGEGNDLSCTIENLTSGFKIVDITNDNWDTQYGTPTPLVVGVDYVLDAKDGGPDPADMSFADDVAGVKDAVVSWNPSTATLKITGNAYKAEIDASVIYLIGTPQNWGINDGSMPLELNDEGVYYGVYHIPSNPTFRFYKALSNWDANSIGSQIADSSLPFELTDGVYEGECVDGKGSWNLTNWNDGWMALTVNLEAMMVTFEATEGPSEPTPGPEAPEKLYILGNIEGNSWNPANAVAPTTAGDGVFTFNGIVMHNTEETGTSWFTFINELNSDWGIINNGTHRYGPAAGVDGALTVGSTTAFTIAGDASWNIPDGTYDFIVDFNTMELTVTEGNAGVDSIGIELNAPVEYYNLQGVKVNNPEKGGVYVVKQGNKTSKVVIR